VAGGLLPCWTVDCAVTCEVKSEKRSREICQLGSEIGVYLQ
jgi:hypothetical protein